MKEVNVKQFIGRVNSLKRLTRSVIFSIDIRE